MWPRWRKCVTVCAVFQTLILSAQRPVLPACQPSEEDVDLSASPAPCLPGSCHASTLMIVDWTYDLVNKPQLNIFQIRLALVMLSVYINKTLTNTHRRKYRDKVWSRDCPTWGSIPYTVTKPGHYWRWSEVLVDRSLIWLSPERLLVVPDKYRGGCSQPTIGLDTRSLMEELQKGPKELKKLAAP